MPFFVAEIWTTPHIQQLQFFTAVCSVIQQLGEVTPDPAEGRPVGPVSNMLDWFKYHVKTEWFHILRWVSTLGTPFTF